MIRILQVRVNHDTKQTDQRRGELNRLSADLQRKIGNYLRATQTAQGGWPLFHDGAFNLSASVKA